MKKIAYFTDTLTLTSFLDATEKTNAVIKVIEVVIDVSSICDLRSPQTFRRAEPFARLCDYLKTGSHVTSDSEKMLISREKKEVEPPP